jgi:hypothetical protein
MHSDHNANSGVVVVPGGDVRFHANDTLWSAIGKVARRWNCTTDSAAERVVVLAMSGWKLKHHDLILEISRFLAPPEGAFQRACLLLRTWMSTWRAATGETLSDSDVTARLEMILDTLRDRDAAGETTDLAELLAADTDEE